MERQCPRQDKTDEEESKHRVWPGPQGDGLAALDPAPQEELGPAVQGDTLADERSEGGPPQRPEVGTKPLSTGGSVPQRQRADPQEEMLSIRSRGGSPQRPGVETKPLSTGDTVPQRQRADPQEEMLSTREPAPQEETLADERAKGRSPQRPGVGDNDPTRTGGDHGAKHSRKPQPERDNPWSGLDGLDGLDRLDELDGPDALEAGTREESARHHCASLATPTPQGGEREPRLRHPRANTAAQKVSAPR